MDAFGDLAQEAGICIASKDSVFSNAKDQAFDIVIKKLLDYPTSKVVICFCEGMTIRRLLVAIERLGVVGKFLIIGRYVISLYFLQAIEIISKSPGIY